MTRAERIAEGLGRLGKVGAGAIAFSEMVAAIETETGFHCDAARFWGKGCDQIIAEIATIQSRDKRRAGVKALVKKYGHASAAQIVARKSGRHIQ